MEEKLMKMLLEVSPEIDPSTVHDDSRLIADLGLTSMKMMVMLMEIEDTFQIELEDTVNFQTVGDVVSYLKSKGC